MDVGIPMHLLMPRDSVSSESIIQSFSHLSEEGRAWFSSEAKLAHAQLASDGKRLGQLLAILTLGVAAACSAVMLLLLWAVAMLAPYLGGLANASGLVGVAVFVVAAISVWAMLHIIREQLGISAILTRWARILKQGPGRKS